jgi:ribosome-associated protein
VEGLREGNWIVIDYGDVIVHIFKDEVRRYYNLEELWSAAPSLEIPEEEIAKGRNG